MTEDLLKRVEQVQNGQHLALLSERVGHFAQALGQPMVDLLTRDRSQEQGYNVYAAENPHSPGLYYVMESGVGWARTTKVYTVEAGMTPANTVEVEYTDVKDVTQLRIDTTIYQSGSLYQEFRGAPHRASGARGEPLLVGEDAFLRDAADMTMINGSVMLRPDGQKSSYYTATRGYPQDSARSSVNRTVSSINGRVEITQAVQPLL